MCSGGAQVPVLYSYSRGAIILTSAVVARRLVGLLPTASCSELLGAARSCSELLGAAHRC